MQVTIDRNAKTVVVTGNVFFTRFVGHLLSLDYTDEEVLDRLNDLNVVSPVYTEIGDVVKYRHENSTHVTDKLIIEMLIKKIHRQTHMFHSVMVDVGDAMMHQLVAFKQKGIDG